jgi:hypothetical protein
MRRTERSAISSALAESNKKQNNVKEKRRLLHSGADGVFGGTQ